MTSRFQLLLPGFDGPVENLPSVVSARELALDDIELASIPCQFLAAAGAAGVDLDMAGEVLAATARLMLMKSIRLLARPDVPEDEGQEPAVRARDPGLAELTRALAPGEGSIMYPSVGRIDSVPRPIAPRPIAGLVDAWRTMAARETEGRARTAVPAFVRLEVAISRVISRLQRGTRLSLRALLGRSSREDAVMHFLATLELLRRGEVRAEQQQTFGDIHIGRSDERGQRTDRVG